MHGASARRDGSGTQRLLYLSSDLLHLLRTVLGAKPLGLVSSVRDTVMAIASFALG